MSLSRLESAAAGKRLRSVTLWIVASAGIMAAIGEWVVASLLTSSLRFRFRSLPLPWTTEVFVVRHHWLLALAAVFFLATLTLGRKKDLSLESVLLILGAMGLVLVLGTTMFVIGAIAPWLPFDPGIKP